MTKQDREERQRRFERESAAFAAECYGRGAKGLSQLLRYALASSQIGSRYVAGKHALGRLGWEGQLRRQRRMAIEALPPEFDLHQLRRAEGQAITKVLGKPVNRRRTVLFNPERRKPRGQRNPQKLREYDARARETGE